jgi:hypothetical protein
LQDNGIRMDRAWMLAMAAAAAHCAWLLAANIPGPGSRRSGIGASRAVGDAVREGANAVVAGTAATPAPPRDGRGRDAASGARRPREHRDAAEQRTAQREAAGLSNNEIAAEQFLALKTVEMTLSNVFRKLGIRSRAQLHGRLDGEDSPGYVGFPSAGSSTESWPDERASIRPEPTS